jgi:ubiquinone/menaquinone biosynthesis C-methylase UbiE
LIDLQKTSKAKAKWDRNAKTYDLMSRFMETRRAKSWYVKLWSNVKGQTVLEVGVGTGKNFPFYTGGRKITAIDFSEGMIAKAEKKAHQSKVLVNLKQMDVQKLEFPDNSFDTVVASCVFCSVPDPVLGFRELRRVLKPEGRLVVLEHMRHKNPVIGKLMDIINPLTVTFSGPSINRRTLENIRKAGFKIETTENLALGGILKLVIARPDKDGQRNPE